jgi:hypothetical protein
MQQPKFIVTTSDYIVKHKIGMTYYLMSSIVIFVLLIVFVYFIMKTGWPKFNKKNANFTARPMTPGDNRLMAHVVNAANDIRPTAESLNAIMPQLSGTEGSVNRNSQAAAMISDNVIATINQSDEFSEMMKNNQYFTPLDVNMVHKAIQQDPSIRP